MCVTKKVKSYSNWVLVWVCAHIRNSRSLLQYQCEHNYTTNLSPLVTVNNTYFTCRTTPCRITIFDTLHVDTSSSTSCLISVYLYHLRNPIRSHFSIKNNVSLFKFFADHKVYLLDLSVVRACLSIFFSRIFVSVLRMLILGLRFTLSFRNRLWNPT